MVSKRNRVAGTVPAVARVPSLALELLHAAGVAKKKKKKCRMTLVSRLTLAEEGKHPRE